MRSFVLGTVPPLVSCDGRAGGVVVFRAGVNGVGGSSCLSLSARSSPAPWGGGLYEACGRRSRSAVRGSGVSSWFPYLVACRRVLLPPCRHRPLLASSSCSRCLVIAPLLASPCPSSSPHALCVRSLSAFSCHRRIAPLPVSPTSRAGRCLLACLFIVARSRSRPRLARVSALPFVFSRAPVAMFSRICLALLLFAARLIRCLARCFLVLVARPASLPAHLLACPVAVAHLTVSPPSFPARVLACPVSLLVSWLIAARLVRSPLAPPASCVHLPPSLSSFLCPCRPSPRSSTSRAGSVAARCCLLVARGRGCRLICLLIASFSFSSPWRRASSRGVGVPLPGRSGVGRCRLWLCSVCVVPVCIYKLGACSCMIVVVERKRTSERIFDND